MHLDPIRHKWRMLTIPPSLQSDLAYWGNPRTLSAGVPLGKGKSYVTVYTDVSLTGWGVMCESQVVGGRWGTPPSLHIAWNRQHDSDGYSQPGYKK